MNTRKYRPARRSIIVLCATLALAGCGLAGRSGSLQTATQYQAEGKYRAAYIEAKKVLRNNDTNGRAWLLLGRSSLMLGDPKSALSNFEKAKAHGVPKARWIVPTGQALLVTRQYEKLLQIVTPDASFDPALAARVAVLRGEALRGSGHADQASRSFRAALKHKPRDPLAWVGLANLSMASGDIETAGEYLDKALTEAPDDPNAWVAKGDWELKKKDTAGAEKAFQKAVGMSGSDWLPQQDFYARMRLADTQARQGKYDAAMTNIQTLEKMSPEQPYPHYLHAVVLYRQGHLDATVDQLQLVLKTKPDNVPAQMLMGVVNYAKGNYGQAEMYLSNVIGMDDGNQAARKLLALTYYREGHSGQAFDLLRSFLPGKTSDAGLLALLQRAVAAGVGMPQAKRNETTGTAHANDTRLGLARQALTNGHAGKAIHLLENTAGKIGDTTTRHAIMLVEAYVAERHVDKALDTAAGYVREHPGNSAAHLLYGTTLVAADKYAAAREQYKKALELDPKSIGALLSTGSLESVRGQLKDAENHYHAALKIDPDNVVAITALGQLAALQGNRSQAIKWYKQAIAIHPEVPDAYLRLMVLYSRTGQFDRATEIAEKLVQAKPGNAAALNALGASELNAGHLDKALEPLRKAVKLAPDTALYRINLARAAIVNKDTKIARNQLETVLKAQPAQARAVRLLAFLRLQDHDLPGALALAKTLQKQPDRQAAGLMLEGDLYMANKAYRKAANAYRQGLEKNYHRAAVMKTYLALNRSGASHPDQLLDNWLAKHPDDAATRLMLAQYELDHGHANRAARQYEKVLETHPSNITALNNLAWIYTEAGNPKALALAKKAHELAPVSTGIQDTYAWALIQANQPGTALPILRKAAKAAPDASTIQYHLAVAQARTGDHAAARRTLLALKQSGSRFRDQQAAAKLYRVLTTTNDDGAGK